MKKAELANSIMRASGLTKTNINTFYKGLVEVVKKEILGDGECVLPGLGILKVSNRKAREGRNPRTGEKIHIARRKAVRFKMYKDLKYALNPHLVKDDARTDEASEAENPPQASGE